MGFEMKHLSRYGVSTGPSRGARRVPVREVRIETEVGVMVGSALGKECGLA
jgi:hypothetical protein